MLFILTPPPIVMVKFKEIFLESGLTEFFSQVLSAYLFKSNNRYIARGTHQRKPTQK